MLKLLFLLILSSVFCSCTNNNSTQHSQDSINTDTAAYILKVLQQSDEDCDSTLSKDCRVVDVAYPEFVDQPALNDSISKRIQTVYDIEKSYPSVGDMIEGFMADYRSFRSDPNFNNRVYTFINKTNVVRNDLLIGVVIDSYIYTGGAHGGTSLTFINWDRQAKKPLSIYDVLKPGSYDSLSVVGERIFRKNEGLSTSDSLKQYFFEDSKFALNENYLFTSEGIKFVYNEYEIKPYSSGRTELLIPYTEIRNLLRPESAIMHTYTAN